MPQWTKEQKDAIETVGTNIIVSAGAGSGKTAVLTERVITKLRQGININELLILTFTKAAAHEMKEKIRQALKKDKSLSSQLDIIDSSYITTFDSYALSVVKKYHYLLNISPNVSIIDNSVIKIKEKVFLNSIFDNLYKEKDSSFLKLIKDLCVKDDENIKNYVLTINNKLNMRPDKEKYLKEYIANVFIDTKIDNDINEYITLIANKIEELKEAIDSLSYHIDNTYIKKLLETLNPLLVSTKYEDIKKNIEIKIPSLPRGNEEAKKYKEVVVDTLKKIKDLCSYSNIKEMKENIVSTKEYVESFIKIINLLDIELNKYKKEHDMYGFTDIALLALLIVENNIEARTEIKHSFKEILIDEYQDTNDIQEAFINLISNNNIYMVGDIKQSIYRFRNANPNIFKDKYDKYINRITGIKIDLNKNFRSRQEVLNNINLIFENIMNSNIGGADYNSGHQMLFGNSEYIETKQNNNIDVYTYLSDNTKYNKEEIEAFIIANDIRNKMESKYQVYDKETKQLRDTTYKDFSILMDRAIYFDLYKNIFEYFKIPLSIKRDEKITDDEIIFIIKNIVGLIVKTKNNLFDTEFKYLFTSIARSFLFEYSDEDIFACFENDKFLNNELIDKITEISKQVDSLTNSELLSLIIKQFNIYEKIIKIGNVKYRTVILDYLSEVASNLSNLGMDIYQFQDYLNNVVTNDYDIKFSMNNSDYNSVNIMTIHISKGLEFPICYYSGLYKEFNISELKEKFMYDPDYNIIAPYTKEGIGTTIYESLFKEKYYKEEISERIRLFYVALTRAKEKIILLLPKNIKKEDKVIELDDHVKLRYSSFLDLVYSINDKLDKYVTDVDIDKLSLTRDYKITSKKKISDFISKNTEKIIVKELNIENNYIKEEHFSKTIHEIMDQETKNNIDLGEYIHRILEIVDLKNPRLDMLPIDNYYKNKIKKFIENPLFSDIKESNIYKEYEFIYEKDILYHGIIDLMIEYPDKINIVDYKLKNIEDEQYIKQLRGYKEYIENKTGKKVTIYLYSIIDEILNKV